jgi:hypothetical protein
LKLLKEYAATNGFAIAQEYVDVEPPSRPAGNCRHCGAGCGE